MAGWYAERRPNVSGKAVIALMVVAFALVAAVPVALVVGVFMMLLIGDDYTSVRDDYTSIR